MLVDARPVDHPTARQRGIGRYVTGLLTGLRDIDAPMIALYGTDAEAEMLADTVPGLTLQRWSPQTVRDHAVDGTWYLATQLMLHPIPLDPIPRCITDARLPVAAVMYDVVPYRYPEIYFTDPNARRQAELRAPLARTVDTLLAISDFAATTAADELAFPLERIATIGAGADRRFTPAADDPRSHLGRVLSGRVGRYVVTVSGSDDRKNTEGLLRAWTHVDRMLGDELHLVIAGAHTPDLLQRWETWAADAGVADRVVFTGALGDDELVALLQGAALAVMPSLEEGFGLPVLEAAACGVPTISSDVSSLPEVLDDPSACFDPHDPQAIAAAIVTALTDESHRSSLLAAGRRAVERWTWSNSASATVAALDAMGPRWPQRTRRAAQRLAVAGVFGDGADGAVSGANEGLVTSLRAAGSNVTALVDTGGTAEPTHVATDTDTDIDTGTDIGTDSWPVRSVGRFVKPWDFDHIIGVLGAAPQHLATSAMARTVPCHLWIHDEAMVGVRFGANLQALEIARSVIVGSGAAAELLRRAADRPCPILVVPPDTGHTEFAAALRTWLDDVDRLDASTIRSATPPIVSANS